MFTNYVSEPFYDELLDESGEARLAGESLLEHLSELNVSQLKALQSNADQTISRMGISFTVYSDKGNIDRLWPFDVLPRTIDADEWNEIREGLVQRVRALNCFIEDVYNEQAIFKAGVMPLDVIESSKDYRPECRGMKLKHTAWACICGSDIVRAEGGKVYVLEDNLRVPSGVSYMLENRAIMKQVMPEAFQNMNILPVDSYPMRLLQMLQSIAPDGVDDPEVVVLTPGIFNSAYYEHAYLAHEMAAELVEGVDLVVLDDDCVYMKQVDGLKKVDVIYRRIDDAFIDPEVFRPDSALGVPGLMRAWKAGNVAIANAPGCGVADDKVVYAHVPDMIRFYLNEEPLIENVPTYLCDKSEDRDYVLEHLAELVVKPANESGGYGMLIGPRATAEEIEEFRQLILDNPRNYIAQPTLKLSTVPTLCEEAIEPRHVDLRPFILQGEHSYVTAGGLTRVALRKGSLVVNSSQGGGSKDTWIVAKEAL